MGRTRNPEKLLLVGGAVVTPQVKAVIEQFAKVERRPIAQVLRQLLEESPRIKMELRRAK